MSMRDIVDLLLKEGWSCAEIVEVLVKTEKELCSIKVTHPECWRPDTGWLCPVCSKGFSSDECPLWID